MLFQNHQLDIFSLEKLVGGLYERDTTMNPGYLVANVSEIPSPAMLIYREKLRNNIKKMIEMAGNIDLLRPHIKTHKMKAVVEMQRNLGIRKFKCATLFEAQILGEMGVEDVFIAYQMVGPNIPRLVDIMKRFPNTTYRTMVDNTKTVEELSTASSAAGIKINLLLDLDLGLHRTGISPGPEAVRIYSLIDRLRGLTADGLHCYDGNNGQLNINERENRCQKVLNGLELFEQELFSLNLPVSRKIMGGSISFPYYTRTKNIETSPGTSVFWDWGYSQKFPDLPFKAAALLLSRIISLPTTTRATIDLGHKAIAADPAGPRGILWNLPNSIPTLQNEEHWVFTCPNTNNLTIGQPIYVFPTHVCPSTALHRHVYVIDGDGYCRTQWNVDARDRV